jgi:hypothetical protein
MTRTAQLTLCVLLLGVADICASDDDVRKDPRMSQRPFVATPACSNPKPYRIDKWSPESWYFSIRLDSGPAYNFSEAERLGQKYKFKFNLGRGNSEEVNVDVVWLEPEQVAALRCESTVRSIEFSTLSISELMPRLVLPNNSLQRP